MAWAYVKGSWVKAEEARISISERGFRYGDGVFETIQVRRGTALFLEDHLARLREGLTALRIPQPDEDITQLCADFLERNNARGHVLRISVSRGGGGRGYLPGDAHPPTVVAELLPFPASAKKSMRLWLSDIRKPDPRSLPVHCKIMQGVNSTLARMEAADHDCDEALMLNADGFICEAGSANIFWQDREGILHTPALVCGVLAGIFRKTLLRIWPEEIQEGFYLPEVIREATGILLTNSLNGPVAVCGLDPQEWRWQSQPLAQMAAELWENAILQQLP